MKTTLAATLLILVLSSPLAAQDLKSTRFSMQSKTSAAVEQNAPSGQTSSCVLQKDKANKADSSTNGKLSGVESKAAVQASNASARLRLASSESSSSHVAVAVEHDLALNSLPTVAPCGGLIKFPTSVVPTTKASADTEISSTLSLGKLPRGNVHTLRVSLETAKTSSGSSVAFSLRKPGARQDLVTLKKASTTNVEVPPGESLGLRLVSKDSVSKTNGGTSARPTYDAVVEITSPVIDSVSPSTLSPSTRQVQLSGRRFKGSRVAVTIDGRAATVRKVTESDILVDLPSRLPAGRALDVVVKHGGGSFILAKAVEIEAPVGAPAFSSIDVSEGRVEGGTSFTISGRDFVPGSTKVLFGDEQASAQATSSTRITGTTPAGRSVGFATIRVETPNGSKETADAYYYAGDPVLDSFNPEQGNSQGVSVNIAGLGLKDVTSVLFGGVPASNVRAIGDDSVQVTAPAVGESQRVSVEVITQHGSAVFAEDFCYTPAGLPEVGEVLPASGPITGGNSIDLVGENFSVCDMTVEINDTSVEGDAINGRRFEGTAPAGEVGFADIEVRVGGFVETIENGYYYEGDPVIERLDPPAGSAQGGDVISIIGVGLKDTIEVLFGDEPAEIFESSDPETLDTELRVEVPSGVDPSSVDVLVRTAHGESRLADAFSFQAFGSLSVEKGKAALTKKGWKVAIKKSSFDNGLDGYRGDASDLVIVVDGVEYFTGQVAVKIKLDKRTGEVAKISMKDLVTKDKASLDLVKGTMKLSLKNIPEADFEPDDGVELEVALDGQSGALVIPTVVVGTKALLLPASAEVGPAEEE